MPDRPTQILLYLKGLYGDSEGQRAFGRLRAIMEAYRALLKDRGRVKPLSERDAILITYADQLREPGIPPLQTLADFAERHLSGLVSGMHILPFYPSSSDDGFSVMDYRAVDPALGGWHDIARLGGGFRLMFDAVLNHASVQGAWFQGFLRNDPRYRDFFISVEGNPDLSAVVRPRTLPLLTPFETADGPRQVWTTFSADQADLNYQDPDVLLEIVDTLLFYVSHGAQLIRLDAIAYLWKEIGTSCIHLPQTHGVIRLFRAVLDELAPQVSLVTETNVPHSENISYFGDGTDEAQLVYNFALPPLLLHTLQTGSARALTGWAAGLRAPALAPCAARVAQSQVSLPSQRTTFFNFLASHDGVGLNPVRGILPEAEIEALVERVQRLGGLVSYKRDAAGGQIPYELNVNYFDALAAPRIPGPEFQIERFVAAHAIMLSLVGLPGIYFHSLFGSRSWPEGPALTGMNRSINRQKFTAAEFERELADPDSIRHRVFARLSNLMKVRASQPAFDPHGIQQVLDWGEGYFALLRRAAGAQPVLCLQNVTAGTQPLQADWQAAFAGDTSDLRDLITGQALEPGYGQLLLRPYQTLWLRTR